MTTNIGIFLFHEAEELDWSGPWEVLGTWAKFHPQEVHVFTVARSPGLVRCAKGLQVQPDHTWSTAPPIDVLVYPGGQGTRAQLVDEEVLSWVRKLHASGSLMTSVCTGSLVFASAGLLDGRAATTHWAALDELSSLGSGINVQHDARFCEHPDVITAAGVSAGIDMALHLVARLGSVQRAREIRRYIQYDPQPPI